MWALWNGVEATWIKDSLLQKFLWDFESLKTKFRSRWFGLSTEFSWLLNNLVYQSIWSWNSDYSGEALVVVSFKLQGATKLLNFPLILNTWCFHYKDETSVDQLVMMRGSDAVLMGRKATVKQSHAQKPD